MPEATLIGARFLCPSVRELTFKASPELSFQPGQWVSVHFPGHRNDRGELLKSAYSIASAPSNDGRFDLCVARIKDSQSSTLLHAASIGDRFPMTGPFGAFLMAAIERPFLMVATGTGIAPFRSMLHATVAQARQPMALLFGNRDESETLYRSEFEALEQSSPLFRFYPTLSQPSSGWTGRVGYVQPHVLDIATRLGAPACDAYVCGQPAMVKDVHRILHVQLGLEARRIHVERY